MMNVSWKALAVSMTIILTGCASKQDASHVPPIWQWPAAAIGTAVGNTIYDRRRNKVKRHIETHYDAIRNSALNHLMWASLSPNFMKTCEVARVNSENCSKLHKELREDKHLYFPDSTGKVSHAEAIENLTVTFMVHGR